MEPSHNKRHPFVDHLLSLTEDRAALAALRSGFNSKPGTVPSMFPYVIPYLPERASDREETAYYILASLFALYPRHTDESSLGGQLAQVKDPNDRLIAEKYFVVLMDSYSIDEFSEYLYHVISILRRHHLPVNWNDVFEAMLQWDNENKRNTIRRKWAMDFWGSAQTRDNESRSD